MRGHRDPGGRERPHAVSEPHTYDPRQEEKAADGWQLWLRPGSTPCWRACAQSLSASEPQLVQLSSRDGTGRGSPASAARSLELPDRRLLPHRLGQDSPRPEQPKAPPVAEWYRLYLPRQEMQ